MTAHFRVVVLVALALGATLVSDSGEAQTAFSASAHIGNFHVAVSNYYRVPAREVIVIRERHISDDDLPVVLFIAQRARVAPARVVDLRLRGLSWWDISLHFGLGPEVYYVPVVVAPGPPYGRAYGHYKKPRKRWRTIVLADPDVVNLVHLRFLSDHYHVAPERVIEMRGRHRDFVAVHTEVSGRGTARVRDADRGPSNSPGRGTGRGNRQ
ncbi:MAG: hypothetical protein ACRD3C_11840 [Vicinamibacterales bacterium]